MFLIYASLFRYRPFFFFDITKLRRPVDIGVFTGCAISIHLIFAIFEISAWFYFFGFGFIFFAFFPTLFFILLHVSPFASNIAVHYLVSVWDPKLDSHGVFIERAFKKRDLIGDFCLIVFFLFLK